MRAGVVTLSAQSLGVHLFPFAILAEPADGGGGQFCGAGRVGRVRCGLAGGCSQWLRPAVFGERAALGS
jgi:hypothetical protein